MVIAKLEPPGRGVLGVGIVFRHMKSEVERAKTFKERLLKLC